jgi:hypothetical protein
VKIPPAVSEALKGQKAAAGKTLKVTLSDGSVWLIDDKGTITSGGK